MNTQVKLLLLAVLVACPLFGGLPHAGDDFVVVDEDSSVTFNPLGNDFDLDVSTQDPSTTVSEDGSPAERLTITNYRSPQNGYVTRTAEMLTYTPIADFNGTDFFYYTITDGSGHFDVGKVTVIVQSQGDDVIAINDNAQLAEDATAVIDVLANDNNPDDDDLIVAGFTQPSAGTVELLNDQTMRYTPGLDFNGQDSFSYVVQDPDGNTDTGTVLLVVSAVNDAPRTSGIANIAAKSNDPNFTIDLTDVFSDPEDGLPSVELVGISSTSVFDSVLVNGEEALPVGGGRVQDGSDSNPGAWPFMAALVQADATIAADGLFCGGVLIHPEWVLTAAHCLPDTSAEDVHVVLGRNDLRTAGGERIQAAELIVHPGYKDDTLENDVALIRLTRASNQPTIRMTVEAEAARFAPGVSATVVGWGITDPDGTEASAIQQQAVLPIVAIQTAAASGLGPFTDTMLAAGFADSTTSPCPGDSGGPLLVSDGAGGELVAGMISFVTPGCINYSGYTRAASFVDWVTARTGIQIAASSLILNYKPGSSGTSVITLRATDAQGLHADTNFTVAVTHENDLPLLTLPSLAMVEDAGAQSLSLYSLAADLEDEDEDLAFTVVSVANGDLFATGPEITGEPDLLAFETVENAFGSAEIVVRVTDSEAGSTSAILVLSVSPVNDAPEGTAASWAVNADAGSTTLDLFSLVSDLESADDQLDFEIVGNTNPDVLSGILIDGNPRQLLRISPATSLATGDHVTTVTVRATDPGGLSSDLVITITVTQDNHAPTVVDDFAFVDEDTTLDLTVMANDSDSDGDSLTIRAFSQPTQGSVVRRDSQTLQYRPNRDATGNDAFTYTVSDGTDLATATVTLTIVALNDAPDAFPMFVVVPEDAQQFEIDPFENAEDPDGDELQLVDQSTPENGIVAFDGAKILYTPNADFAGTDSFVFTVSDPAGAVASAAVMVIVEGAPDAPVAAADFVVVPEDQQTQIDVLANDLDVDIGDVLTLVDISDPNGASAWIQEGQITFEPVADFTGTSLLTYTVHDRDGLTDSGVLTVEVTAQPDAPELADSAIATDEDVTLSGVLTAVDADGDTTTLELLTQPALGVLTLAADGSFTFTPTADANGSAVALVRVTDATGRSSSSNLTIEIAPVNDAPEIASRQFNVNEDGSLTIELLAGATDPDGDTPILGAIQTFPATGSLTLAGTQATYSPNADSTADDSFVYQIIDGNGGSTTAEISLTVIPQNDAPKAADDVFVTQEDVAISGNVLTNDSDPDLDTLTASGISGPGAGQITLLPDGSFTYVPDPDATGADSFTYAASDGVLATTATVTVLVQGANDDPTTPVTLAAVTEEDTPITLDLVGPISDVDNDPVRVVQFISTPALGGLTAAGTGTYLYTPAANVSGPDSFRYLVVDGQGGSLTVTMEISITPVDDAPVANPDVYSVQVGSVLTVSAPGVLSNDSDVDSNTQTTSLLVPAANGTVTVSAEGSFSYQSDVVGSDSFTYQVSGGISSAIGLVTITVTAEPVVAPVANSATYTVAEDESVSAELTTAAVSASIIAAPSRGTVTLVDRTFSYVPDGDENGSDSFVFVLDNGSATASGTITIEIQPVNDDPVLDRNVPVFTAEDTAVVIDLLEDVSDADGDVLFVGEITAPSSGTLSGLSGSSVTFTPQSDFSGDVELAHTVVDGAGGSVAITRTIRVQPTNDRPIAEADQYSIAFGHVLEVRVQDGVLLNDFDGEGQPLTVDPLTGPENGSLTLNAGGAFTYVPAVTFFGEDSFTYRVGDGEAFSNSGVVSLSVEIDSLAGDFDSSGAADEEDVNALLLAFGTNNLLYDLVQDGIIDFRDLTVLVSLVEQGGARYLAHPYPAGIELALLAPHQVAPNEVFSVNILMRDASGAYGVRGGALDLHVANATPIGFHPTTAVSAEFAQLATHGQVTPWGISGLGGVTLAHGVGTAAPATFATVEFQAPATPGTVSVGLGLGNWHLGLGAPAGLQAIGNIGIPSPQVVHVVAPTVPGLRLTPTAVTLPVNSPVTNLLAGVTADRLVSVNGYVDWRQPGVYAVDYSYNGLTQTRNYTITPDWRMKFVTGNTHYTIGMATSGLGAGMLAFADSATWTLVPGPGGLSWDPLTVPPGALYLEPRDAHGVSLGYALDAAAYGTAPFAASYLVRYEHAIETVDVALVPGWNLVGVPLNLLDSTLGVLGATVTGPVWTYEHGEQSQADRLRAGRAYWVNSTAATMLRLRGTRAGYPTVGLSAGWNLIALPTTDRRAQISVPEGSRVYAWDEFMYQPVSEGLHPGVGYWIWSPTAHELPVQ